MPSWLTHLLIILALLLVNGFFALAEIALVSSRRSRLRQFAEEGRRGAQLALRLTDDPAVLLSSVQVGITLVGILAGAYGGATLGRELADALAAALPAYAGLMRAVGFALVVVAITYFTLIIGELVPKRIALNNPERYALRVAPVMGVVEAVAGPLIHLLSLSTELVISAMRLRPPEEPPVTDEEVRWLLEEGVVAGVFERAEEEIVNRLFRLSDRRISSLMTPRPEVVWLDINDPPEEITRTITSNVHSAYPVGEGDLDKTLGIVLSRDIVACIVTGESMNLRAMLKEPVVMPEGYHALKAFEQLRRYCPHMAIIVDEYGAVAGIVTLNDLFESLVGEMPLPAEEAEVVQRPDGSWLVDGAVAIEELKDLLNVRELPDEELGYRTLAGFILTFLGRIPDVGDAFDWDRFHFEVVDMDGNRIDRVLIVPLAAEKEGEE